MAALQDLLERLLRQDPPDWAEITKVEALLASATQSNEGVIDSYP